MGQAALFSEVRQILAHISTLQEEQERLLTSLNKMEARINTLKNPPENNIGTESCAKKMAAAIRGSANDHPSVKVSQQIRPPMILISTHPFHQPLVHMLFYEMYGVKMSSNKAKCTVQLYAVKLLNDDLAFKVINGKETWHPH